VFSGEPTPGAGPTRRTSKNCAVTRCGTSDSGSTPPFAHCDEAIVLVERQRAENHGIYDGEDGCRRPDAEREDDENCYRDALGGAE